MTQAHETENERLRRELGEAKQQLADQDQLIALAHSLGTQIRVSAKGGLSVYGLGKFPVTLYRSQWERLIAMVPAIQAFIRVHRHELPDKEK